MSASERHETHISEVHVAGAFAWKRKKAVRFDFLDFSTLPLRERFCREEVRVNRRLAPALYLGVAPLRRGVGEAGGASGEGESLRLGALDPMGGAVLSAAEEAAYRAAAPWASEKAATHAAAASEATACAPGELVDWCVVMRRLPADGMADAMVARGEFTRERAEALAETLLPFHRAARVAASAAALAPCSAAAQAKRQRGVLEEAQKVAPPPSHAVLAALERESTRFLREEAARFDRRADAGALVDGHGDLHCGNLCLVDGALLPFDALEFDERLRIGDVASDLAFLTMDLRRRGAAPAAAALIERYVAASGDGELRALLPWYESQRAAIRGNVAALRAAQASGGEREAAANEARAAWSFALLTLARGPLIAMCGLQGSGKSRLARALAERLGALHLQADAIRKELAGLPIDRPTPPERRAALYHDAAIAAVYAELLSRAEAPLRAGRPVVLDATYHSVERRAAAAALAQRCGVPFVVVHCRADEATIEARLRRRPGEAGQSSDADLAVYRAARATFTPPDELPEAQRIDVESRDGLLDDPRDAVLAGPLGALIAALALRVAGGAVARG